MLLAGKKAEEAPKAMATVKTEALSEPILKPESEVVTYPMESSKTTSESSKVIDETVTMESLKMFTYDELCTYAQKVDNDFKLLINLEEETIFKLSELSKLKLKGISKVPLIELIEISAETETLLMKYSECFATGKLNGINTIQLIEIDSLPELEVQIIYLEKLTDVLSNIKDILPYARFISFLSRPATLDKFISVCKEMNLTFYKEKDVVEIMNLLESGYKVIKNLISFSNTFIIDDIAQFMKLTYSEFEMYAMQRNVEWAKATFLTEDLRKFLWAVLENHYAGLTKITLTELKPFYIAHKTLLKDYSDIVTYGKIDGKETIQLIEFDTLKDIEKHMQYLSKLTSMISNLKNVMPLNLFLYFVAHQQKIEGLIAYCEIFHPSFTASKGRELQSFVSFYQGDVQMLSGLKTALPTIKSYHKFNHQCIQKLIMDFNGNANDKPLTILLYPSKDNSGAFIQKNDINNVILNGNIKVIVIEGENISSSYIQKIILEHGMNQKLAQLMIAGHGSSTTIAIEREKSAAKGNNIVSSTHPMQDVEELHGKPLDKFISGSEEWRDFFKMIRANMAGQNGITPKILLDACLVATHKINFKDPAFETSKDQTDIRAAIVEQFQNNPNIVEFIEQSMKRILSSSIPVIGARGSLDSKICTIEPNGNLCLMTEAEETYLTGSKINYITNGQEAVGVILALIEEWSCKKGEKDKKKFLSSALKRREEKTIFDTLINILFDIIEVYEDNILMAAHCSNTASVLQAILTGVKRPLSCILEDEIIKRNFRLILPILLGRLDIDEAAFTKRLTILQAYYFLDHTKARWLLELLGNDKLDKSVYPFIYAKELKSTLNVLLNTDTFDLNGRIFLALFFASKHANKDSITFIKKLYESYTPELTLLADRLSFNIEKLIKAHDDKSDTQRRIPINEGLYMIFKDSSLALTMDKIEFPIPEEEVLERSEKPDNQDSTIAIIGEVRRNDDTHYCYMVRFSNYQIGYIYKANEPTSETI